MSCRGGARALRAVAACAAGVLLLVMGVASARAAGSLPPGRLLAGQAVEGEPDEPAAATEADRIIGVRSLLRSDGAWLAELERELERLRGQFDEAASAFDDANAKLLYERQSLGRPGAEGADAERREAIAPLERAWLEARDRFNLVIERRKAVRQQIETLREKIELEEELLRMLLGEATEEEPEVGPGAAPAAPRRQGPRGIQDRVGEAEGEGLSAPGLAWPTVDALGAGKGGGGVEAPPTAAAAAAEMVDEELAASRRALEGREAEFAAARRELELIDRSITVFERDLGSAEQLLETARNEAKAAAQAQRDAGAWLREREEAGATEREAASLREELADAGRRVEAARRDLAMQTARLAGSEGVIEYLRGVRAEAAERVEAAAAAEEEARKRVRFLESPAAPHRLRRWVTENGPNVLLIAVVMLVLRWLSGVVGHRIVVRLVRRGRRGSLAEREERAETLRRVFQSSAGIAILVVGGLALLSQAGVDVTVLLGGAAVLGAAIAFGSQNLIKDCFAGFMILVENQYSVGNVVEIGGVVGSVEDITLRMTALRDEEGVVHFIPHSQVTTVSNLTYGWSRAVFNVRVGHGEDVERVMSVLMDLAHELREDETFGPQMLGEPEMLGVDAIDESAVVVKFLVKTRPLKQWSVKREMLRRIKARFDKLGIETPLPGRTVYLRGEYGAGFEAGEMRAGEHGGDGAV